MYGMWWRLWLGGEIVGREGVRGERGFGKGEGSS